MKNLIILLVMIIMIFSCAIPENTESSNDTNNTTTVLSDVVLHDGVMNDTTNLLFQKTTYGFPNSVIQVKFEFSDPEVFDNTHTIKTNTTTNAHTISIFALQLLLISKILI